MTFLRDEGGLETIEYIAVAALISLFLFAILATIFHTIQDKLREVNDAL